MHRRNLLKFSALSSAVMLLQARAASSVAATPKVTQSRSTEMSNVNERVALYIAAWNEQDPKKRRELVERTFTDDGRYVDAHRNATGHAALDAMIDAAQRMFPGYRLRLISGIETHNGNVRFSWAAGGTDGAPLYLGGTDFAAASADGRFQSVVGFVDAAPAR